MEYNPSSIITGISILFLVSYFLITSFTFLYITALKKSNSKKTHKILLATSLVSLAWILSTFLSLILSSSGGVMLFAILSLFFIFIASYFFTRKAIGFTTKENIIYAISAAVLFNPAWLTLTGVL